jgi:NTE family protein
MDDMPGALELMRDALRGRARRYRLPSLTTLLLNTSLMNSYARQQQSQALVDLHFAPAVRAFGLLEWSQFDLIVEAGYRHAIERLERLGDAAVATYRD